MHLVTLIAAGVAAAIHVWIFVLESLRWEHAETRRIFGTTPEQAATTRQLAYNQGFYNLFLALAAFGGVVLAGWPVVSTTLLLVSLGSMLAAAVVLVTSDRRKARAALIQGGPPALALLAMGFSAFAGSPA